MTVIAAMSAQATIPVDQAVGMVLPHDITEIVRDSFKGRAFKKGHIIREQDVDHLRRLGKEHIYVLRLGPDEIHENEAALQLAEALAGSGVGYAPEVVEGKVSLRATADGLLRVDREGWVPPHAPWPRGMTMGMERSTTTREISAGRNKRRRCLGLARQPPGRALLQGSSRKPHHAVRSGSAHLS